jgi:hypothetical protein
MAKWAQNLPKSARKVHLMVKSAKSANINRAHFKENFQIRKTF